MAFKPIVKTETINGVTFKAQFSGITASSEVGYLANEDVRKVAPYLFDNVLVEPKIKDIDEYFGTNMKFYNDVVAFLGAVASADPKYFPDTTESADGAKGKE